MSVTELVFILDRSGSMSGLESDTIGGFNSLLEKQKKEKGEAFVYGMNISPYEKGNIFNREPLRKRRLLLHKREIMKLAGQVQAKGYTLMPLQVYFKNGRVKIEVGLARGKKLYDKRDDLKKKAMKRETERDFRNSQIKM
mgnify:CR=1 FL=1